MLNTSIILQAKKKSMQKIINRILKGNPVARVLNRGYKKRKLEKGQKICVVPGAYNRLGDMIMNNYFIRQLQKEYQVFYAVPEWFFEKHKDFLQHHSTASGIFVCPAGRWQRFRFSMRMRKEKFSALVLLPNIPDRMDRCMYMAGIPAICGIRGESSFATHFYNLEKFAALNHYTHLSSCILDAFGCPYTIHIDTAPWLPFKKNRTESAGLNNQLIMAIHIGGGDYLMRKWPADKYFKICMLFFGKYKGTIYLVGGEDEFNMNENLREKLLAAGYSPNALINYCGTTLNKFANILDTADLFFGNDSGPMHVATAIRKQVVCIFGPSNMPFVNPTAVDPANISIHADLDCVPCFAPNCRLPADKQYSCLNDLSVMAVWQKLDMVLENIHAGVHNRVLLDK